MSDKKTPSIWEMTKSFTRDLSKWVAEGAPNVSQDDYKQRLSDCNSCEHLIRDKMRCGKCGCLVEHKAKWKTTKCPIDVWKPQIIKDDQVKEGDNTNTSNEI